MAYTKRDHARNVLRNCAIEIGADFHKLSSGRVGALLAWAKHDRYRAPKNASGSTARYYHDKMQRQAQRAE